MNNPVEYIDSTGELAWPGEIHNQVVLHIAEKNGLYWEQRIDYAVGWGRADLIDETGQVWEVKRDKPRQIANGIKQLQKYTENKWHNHDNVVLSVGGWIDPDSFIYESGLTTYYVSYRYAGDGVIAYDYYAITDWKTVGDVAVGIVIIAGVAFLIFSTGGAAVPSLVPVLV